MGTSIIDGTIEQATLKSARKGVSVLKDVRFQLTDGTSRTLKTVVATNAVADHLKPGDAGRFYLYTSMDLKGVHGVRRADGTAVYGFPNNNAIIFVILVVVNLLWIAFKVAVDGQVPFLGVGLTVLGVVAYVLSHQSKNETRRQFDADSAFAPSPSQPPPPGPASITV